MEADMIVTFKTLLDRYVRMKGYGSFAAEGIGLIWHGRGHSMSSVQFAVRVVSTWQEY